MSISSELRISPELAQHASRTAPRVPQTPIPGLGLDSIAPGRGTATHSRRAGQGGRFSDAFAATVDVDGEHLNVAYADSDDLAMFVLAHPGASR